MLYGIENACFITIILQRFPYKLSTIVNERHCGCKVTRLQAMVTSPTILPGIRMAGFLITGICFSMH